ncbi:unnamed protein product [Paramecium sonneborni]|uniref:Transmembrane protein n=1 Tax=Paramecium sonneborni TaxID=65129 RepID=A0A8S1PDR8_9CILI|nr:unnamed protein product [Paramecium sonneborni]
MEKALNTIEKSIYLVFLFVFCLIQITNDIKAKLEGQQQFYQVVQVQYTFYMQLYFGQKMKQHLLQAQKSMIELSLEDFNGGVDPFKKENNIITPLLVTFMNTTVKEKPIPLYSDNQNPYRIELSNVNLVLNTLDSYDDTKKILQDVQMNFLKKEVIALMIKQQLLFIQDRQYFNC